MSEQAEHYLGADVKYFLVADCHFWTHNPNVGRCWLKKSDLGKGPSYKGSISGQKSCGVTGGRYLVDNPLYRILFFLEDDLLSGHVVENGCDCTQETTEGC